MSISTQSTIPIKQLESVYTLFLDANIAGKKITEILTHAKLRVARLTDEYASMTPDDVWIRGCAAKHYFIITCDKRIETDPINRQAVIESKSKIVVLEDSGNGVSWAAAIVVSREAIYRQLHAVTGPAILPLSRSSSKLLGVIWIPTPIDPTKSRGASATK